jgi:glucose-1-phosphate thymidylyltransferase
MSTLGIILAGGHSSRCYPATFATTKQLAPIYDKPLVYYPLSTLMAASVKDILIITNPHEQKLFTTLLDRTGNLGVDFSLAIQDEPKGIPQALQIAKNTVGDGYDSVCLILGDNIFHGDYVEEALRWAMDDDAATIFAQRVKNPERFGVIEFENHQPSRIVEKPTNPPSSYAVTGLYHYPMDVYERVEELQYSDRDELEITDLNNLYLQDENLNVEALGTGVCWFDTGTPDSMNDAANYVRTIQQNHDTLVGSPHAIAYKYEWIGDEDILELANTFDNDYTQRLKRLL